MRIYIHCHWQMPFTVSIYYNWVINESLYLINKYTYLWLEIASKKYTDGNKWSKKFRDLLLWLTPKKKYLTVIWEAIIKWQNTVHHYQMKALTSQIPRLSLSWIYWDYQMVADWWTKEGSDNKQKHHQTNSQPPEEEKISTDKTSQRWTSPMFVLGKWGLGWEGRKMKKPESMLAV